MTSTRYTKRMSEGKKLINPNSRPICTGCDGTGQFDYVQGSNRPCQACGGTGLRDTRRMSEGKKPLPASCRDTARLNWLAPITGLSPLKLRRYIDAGIDLHITPRMIRDYARRAAQIKKGHQKKESI